MFVGVPSGTDHHSSQKGTCVQRMFVTGELDVRPRPSSRLYKIDRRLVDVITADSNLGKFPRRIMGRIIDS